ncbi:MAG TPA: hypothetical protein PK079_07025 [Leptospiraceae bacterium]|nr:hypothetical protein [Leptospiraceae bacterium]HMW05972.1 hypothetical protein [Leptospiraceae bacterium]HMX32096.1 hypothetical protein [Leptospiraceae bacterium]HMY32326.1 hypothetical protein [Leptospiraceae bacterium]HMZ62472.1 hypothetical protein [Leptospiraceae bacterium]
MPVKVEKVIKIKKWTSTVFNSNEKRVKECLKEILPRYKTIHWDEEKFIQFYIDVLNSLPCRYKQKNSIELTGKLKKQVLMDAICDKLDELSAS